LNLLGPAVEIAVAAAVETISTTTVKVVAATVIAVASRQTNRRESGS